MSTLKVDSIDIDEVVVDGKTIDTVYSDGVRVWDRQAPSGSQTFDASGTFVVPYGYNQVSIQLCGAGGSGAASSVYTQDAGGGYSGESVCTTVDVTSGQSINVTIGTGGASVSDGAGGYTWGNSGGSSSFGGITALGGYGGETAETNTTYRGAGSEVVHCTGTTLNGTRDRVDNKYYWGGRGGAFGNGGNGGADFIGGATDGGIGAGGGGGETSSGAGGNGRCIVTWTREY